MISRAVAHGQVERNSKILDSAGFQPQYRCACSAPLISATLVQRYKRFLADVDAADGEIVTAHVANPGAMIGLASPGARVWLSKSDRAGRKLPHLWELVEADFGLGLELVGVNTGASQPVGRRGAGGGPIPELSGYDTIRREVKYGKNSRVDFLLESATRPPAMSRSRTCT